MKNKSSDFSDTITGSIKQKFCFLFLALLSSFSTLYAADTLNRSDKLGTYYGLYASYNYNQHSCDLRQLPGFVDYIPRYATGFNSGFSFGVFYGIPVSSKSLFAMRALFNYDKAEVQGNANSGIIITAPYGLYDYHHIIRSNLSGLKLEPLFYYKFIGDLSVFAGGNMGISLKKSTEHIEYITGKTDNPDTLNVGFMNHWSNENISLQASFVAGLNYDLPLTMSGKYLLGIELSYTYGFANIVDNLVFDNNSLRLGVSFKYSTKFYKPPKPPYVPPKPPPQPELPLPEKPVEQVAVNKEIPVPPNPANEQPKSADTLLFSVFGLNNGTEIPLDRITIEEHYTSTVQPLLNYIFFDLTSSKIPAKYKVLSKSEANRFNMHSLFGLDALGTYYNILNITGYRMKQNPDIKIALKGICRNNDKAEGLKFSGEMTESVANYLTDIWGIDQMRISVSSTVLSVKMLKEESEDALSEDCRVEIKTNNPELFETVSSFDTLRIAEPSDLRFRQTYQGSNPVESYKISYYRTNEFPSEIPVLENYKAESLPESIDYNLKNSPQLVNFTASVTFLLRASLKDSSSRFSRIITSGKVNVPVSVSRLFDKTNKITDNKKYDRFSLILFDYDESKLTDENRKIIRYIASKAETGSEITIEGFTDRRGDEEHNLKLSQQRANSVAEALKEILGEGYIYNVSGKGETELFSNDTPEGRYYNRTVVVTIVTPVKK